MDIDCSFLMQAIHQGRESDRDFKSVYLLWDWCVLSWPSLDSSSVFYQNSLFKSLREVEKPQQFIDQKCVNTSYVL